MRVRVRVRVRVGLGLGLGLGLGVRVVGVRVRVRVRGSSAYFMVDSAVRAAISGRGCPPVVEPPVPPVPVAPPDEPPLESVRLAAGAPLSPPMKMSMETTVPSSSSSMYCAGTLICAEMAFLSTWLGFRLW